MSQKAAYLKIFFARKTKLKLPYGTCTTCAKHNHTLVAYQNVPKDITKNLIAEDDLILTVFTPKQLLATKRYMFNLFKFKREK